MAVAYRTQAANDDLLGIAYQIGVESGRPIVAERIIDELVDRCDQLADFAHFARSGTPAPEIGDGVRLLSHRRWVIIFRYLGDGVLILRIADGSQDYLSWRLS